MKNQGRIHKNLQLSTEKDALSLFAFLKIKKTNKVDT